MDVLDSSHSRIQLDPARRMQTANSAQLATCSDISSWGTRRAWSRIPRKYPTKVVAAAGSRRRRKTAWKPGSQLLCWTLADVFGSPRKCEVPKL